MYLSSSHFTFSRACHIASNAFLGSVPGKLAMVVDMTAVLAVTAFFFTWLQEKTKAQGAGMADTLCLFSVDQGQEVCGRMSFDSSENMACIEVVDKDGRMRWVCS